MFSIRRKAVFAVALAAAVTSGGGVLGAPPGGARGPGGYGPGAGYGGFAGGGYGGYSGYSGYSRFGGGNEGYGSNYSSGGAPFSGYGYYPPYRGTENAYPGNGGFPGYPASGYYGSGNAGYNAGAGSGASYNGAVSSFAGGYNNQGNRQPDYYPYPVIVPYGGGYGPGNGYGYGPNGPGPGAAAPQRRFAPANSNYLYGQDGSVSFYATPDPTPPVQLPADDTPQYVAPDYRSAPTVAPPPVPPQEPLRVARVVVHLPAEAHLWFEGKETRQSGEDRTFKSTPLETGRPYLYDLKARWWQDGKPVERTKTITVRSGEVTHVDLTFAN